MGNIIKNRWLTLGVICLLLFSLSGAKAALPTDHLCGPKNPQTLTESAISNELGWVASDENRCGGYYLEPPFIEAGSLLKNNLIKITGNEGVFSLHSTSIYEGKVTISQNGQQIITNKAYVYRDSNTENYSAIDLIGNVILREPDDLILAECGYVDLKTNFKSLREILYRSAIYSPTHKAKTPTHAELQQERKVVQLSAWGKAQEFKQEKPRVYEFVKASYSTCPPLNNTWQLQADDIILNKDTGRGFAKHAKLLVKGVPVLYAPYLNFPIDARRQSGFLWPTIGSSTETGPSIKTPYYWNLAPNYDDTITPAILGKRGFQLNNLFRYLTPSPASDGALQLTALPNDRMFHNFKQSQKEKNQSSTNPVTQSELHRLENSSTTRGAISWQNKTYFNKHWTADVDYNFVSDDYYLKDFSNGLNEITPNQLLQQADLTYQGKHWRFIGRVQGYQTLHPIGENSFFNQYIRLPQFVLEGDYSDNKIGLNYTMLNDLTRFDIAKNPGNLNPGGVQSQPIGDRLHVQPGINFPFYRPAFYVNPRIQFAMTQYEVSNVLVGNPHNPGRALPIFDVNSGLYFDRNISLLNHAMRQTLEPKVYYTYVPYRNQNKIPVFDTTVNTLTYDQLFTYNRFNGLDRIGDANQVSVGLTTRFIDQQSGFEKISAGLGQIFYFEHRRVTLCDSALLCNDFPDSPENTSRRSPLSGVLTYNLTPYWSASANTIWNTHKSELDNQTFTLQYLRDIQRFMNLSYTYVRNVDKSVITISNSANTLSQTDFSFTWPVLRDWSAVGRWTENWNTSRFQNLLYGLQYDSCCWAIRFVTGRTYTNLTPNNTYQYNTEFYVQFALKGLGSFGSGNPGRALNSSIIANETNFGQDF